MKSAAEIVDATQAPASCDCIERVDTKLAEYNTKIELPWFGPQLPRIITSKKDSTKRGKPMHMFATFCPFCGVKYTREEQ